MDEVFDLIDQIIKEHEQIVPEVQNLERMTDDPEAILALERAKEDFLPVRTNAQEQGLQNLEELLRAIDQRLKVHFDREERGLLTAFEKRGDKMVAAALRVLLLEHEELKNRITKSREEVTELVAGGLSREVWEGKASGIRVYINHTCSLLKAHAQSEQELFQMVRKELST